MGDGGKPLALEPLHLIIVVHYVAKTIERGVRALQLLLGLAYGTDHSVTEARTGINLNHRITLHAQRSDWAVRSR